MPIAINMGVSAGKFKLVNRGSTINSGRDESGGVVNVFSVTLVPSLLPMNTPPTINLVPDEKLDGIKPLEPCVFESLVPCITTTKPSPVFTTKS